MPKTPEQTVKNETAPPSIKKKRKKKKTSYKKMMKKLTKCQPKKLDMQPEHQPTAAFPKVAFI